MIMAQHKTNPTILKIKNDPSSKNAKYSLVPALKV